MFTFLLLVAIVALLWIIHQDLGELTDRQRGLKVSLERVATSIERLHELIRGLDTNHEEEIRIPINSASKTQLRRLPKVGAVIADRIIAGRPFADLESLGKVEGLTAQMLDGLREHISFD